MSDAAPQFKRPNNFKAAEFYNRMVRLAPEPAVFVELGANEGRSAWDLGTRIRASGKSAKLLTVDSFAISRDPGLEEDCRRNLAPLVRSGVVEVVKDDSAGYAARCPYRKVDLVFVDAAHDYRSVKADIQAWLPMIKRGGFIAGDDFWWRARHQGEPAWRQVPDVAEYPVWRAVDECLGGRYQLTARDSWAIWWMRIGT